jgi:hypothetical protein
MHNINVLITLNFKSQYQCFPFSSNVTISKLWITIPMCSVFTKFCITKPICSLFIKRSITTSMCSDNTKQSQCTNVSRFHQMSQYQNFISQYQSVRVIVFTQFWITISNQNISLTVRRCSPFSHNFKSQYKCFLL